MKLATRYIGESISFAIKFINNIETYSSIDVSVISAFSDEHVLKTFTKQNLVVSPSDAKKGTLFIDKNVTSKAYEGTYNIAVKYTYADSNYESGVACKKIVVAAFNLTANDQLSSSYSDSEIVVSIQNANAIEINITPQYSQALSYHDDLLGKNNDVDFQHLTNIEKTQGALATGVANPSPVSGKDLSTVSKVVNELDRHSKTIYRIMDSSQISNKYNQIGYYNNNGIIYPNYQRHTPLFKVAKGQKIEYILSGVAGFMLIAAFDDNFGYVSTNSLASDGTVKSGTWVAGDTTCFVGFSAESDAKMILKPFSYTISNNEVLYLNLSINLQKALFTVFQSSEISTKYNSNGFYRYGVGSIYPTYNRYTPLFKVAKGQKINYYIKGDTTGYISIVAAFDVDFNYIQSNSIQANGNIQSGTWVAGDTTCFVGFASITDADMVLNACIKESELALPNIIPTCIGLEFNIYNNSLRAISDERENYTKVRIAPPVNKGMQKPDRFNFYQSTTISDYACTAYQETLTGSIFDAKSFTLKCIDKKVVMHKNRINVLPIGDSIMENGYYMRAIQDNFAISAALGGSNIRFVGNKTHNPLPDVNNLGNIYDEGHSGWATTHFITTGRSVGDALDGVNPLWNANRIGGADIDFVNYLSNLNTLPRYQYDTIDTIDALMIALGTNDPNYCTLSQYIVNINTLTTKLWRDYPDAIVLIATIPPMGLNSPSKPTRVIWNIELINQFETVIKNSTGTGRVYLCPAHYAINRTIGYNITGKSRIPNEYTYEADGYNYNLHPSLIGGQQFGDALFSGIMYALQRHKVSL